MKGEILEITSKQAWEFLKPRHYAGRKPPISRAFGWEIDGQLVAVCTFGKPASNTLCVGICGEKYSHNVYELNRLCRIEELKEPLSEFVATCLRRLKDENWIIVSYSDTGMHHNGYIYQALNFLYTGQTKQRTDKWTEGNKHSRHYSNSEQGKFRKVRTAKKQICLFCDALKETKKRMVKRLELSDITIPQRGKSKLHIRRIPKADFSTDRS